MESLCAPHSAGGGAPWDSVCTAPSCFTWTGGGNPKPKKCHWYHGQGFCCATAACLALGLFHLDSHIAVVLAVAGRLLCYWNGWRSRPNRYQSKSRINLNLLGLWRVSLAVLGPLGEGLRHRCCAKILYSELF